MSEKLRILTDKIYNEGVEKAKKESSDIIEKAKAEAKLIKEEAEKFKADLIEETEQNLANKRKKIEADIKLAAQKAANKLKFDLQNIIAEQIIENPVKQALSKPEMMANLLTNCLQVLQKTENNQFHFVVNNQLEDQVNQYLQAQKQQLLQAGFTLKGSGNIAYGFEVIPEGKNYRINFTDQAFVNFISSFLKIETKTILTDSE